MKKLWILLLLMPLFGCTKTHVVKFHVEGAGVRFANITKVVSINGSEQKSTQLVELPWIDSFTAKTGTGVAVVASGTGADLSGIIVTLYIDGVAVQQGQDVSASPSASAGGKL